MKDNDIQNLLNAVPEEGASVRLIKEMKAGDIAEIRIKHEAPEEEPQKVRRSHQFSRNLPAFIDYVKDHNYVDPIMFLSDNYEYLTCCFNDRLADVITEKATFKTVVSEFRNLVHEIGLISSASRFIAFIKENHFSIDGFKNLYFAFNSIKVSKEIETISDKGLKGLNSFVAKHDIKGVSHGQEVELPEGFILDFKGLAKISVSLFYTVENDQIKIDAICANSEKVEEDLRLSITNLLYIEKLKWYIGVPSYSME